MGRSEGEMRKKERRILALTGAAALAAIALNLLFTALNARKSKKNQKKTKDIPGLVVRINLTAAEILKLADSVIAKSKEVHDSVASVPLDKVTYANVVLPLAELEAQQFPLVQSCVFQKMVATSDDVQKASAEAERRIDSHLQMCSKREDVYRVLKAFAAKGEWISIENRYYVQRLVKDFERNGMNLTRSKREEVERLNAQIDELSMRYIQNLNEDNTTIVFRESELAGLPREFMKSLDEAENGKVKINLRSHHLTPILEHCKVGATRKKVAVAQGQRCAEQNLHILENLVHLRHKLARLLGYSNYADYVVEPRMARTSTKVFEFLEEISICFTDFAHKELNMLKDLKKKEEGDSVFGIEDLLYYIKRAEEQEISQDEVVKQYFPVGLVLSGIFKIFQDLFGLRFEEIKEPEVWHDDVCLFSVLDFSSNELLGYFYLDLYSRKRKYDHMCVVALQSGCILSNSACQIPVALIISQLPKQTNGDPGLLQFSEVVSLFHEFSHVVHHICNRASHARFSGLRGEADFMEIPGKLLENWCYESLPLKMMSGFHQDITKSISDEMCRLLKRKRDFFSGLKVKQEILLCLFDEIIHSSENVDMVELLKHLHPKVMLGIPLLEGTNPASCFSRLAIGYEAACYSRIWSEVFAADIFAAKFQDGLLNQHIGLQFKKKVLAPGGSKDPMEILCDFLGRKPSIQAYVEQKTRNSI